jgi:elongation factor Ts
MAFTAKDVAELRRQTGCGMMDCKNALVAADGNFDEAIKVLREKGMAATAKKASRIAAEGIVDILTEGNVTAMVEVNSETDFVAKNESFRAFVRDILKAIIANRPADVDELMTKKINDAQTVKEALEEKTFTIGEKLSIRRFLIVDGVVSTYIHGMGATGVIIKFEADDAAVANPGFAEFAKNIALQAAAMPCLYVNKESVPASAIEEEREILTKQMEQDPKFAGKPQKVLDGIIMGKLGKFYETNCLTEQAYVKDDSMTVGKYVNACAKEFGGAIKLEAFYRYDKGEGIQKREENFAEEIAKLVK